MGRSQCCEKVGLKKGPWTPEEDQKLLAYIQEHGHGSWRALPSKAGLQRCGKSCRLRWTNYLRPDIKRGKFSLQEEQTIIQLHALIGNRWSAIATHLPKRTDNEIKNYWNTHLKKRLAKMGIDPVTHKPKSATLTSIDGQFKNDSNLSHMAQWESTRLDAEARLVRESKLRSSSATSFQHHQLAGSSSSAWTPAHQSHTPWQGMWSKSNQVNCDNLEESPSSTLTFSDQNSSLPVLTVGLSNPTASIEFLGNAGSSEGVPVKVEGQDEEQDLKSFGKLNNFMRLENSSSMTFSSTLGLHEMVFPEDQEAFQWTSKTSKDVVGSVGPIGPVTVGPFGPVTVGPIGPVPVMNNFIDRFTDDHLLHHSSGHQHHHHHDLNSSDGRGGELSHNNNGECTGDNAYNEEEIMNKDYWNNIFHLVDSSLSDSPVF